MIAMAIAGSPEVLIADEPTTALDVTVQARVLDLLREVQQETNVAMLFVSHDLGVIAQMCDRVQRLLLRPGRRARFARLDPGQSEAPVHSRPARRSPTTRPRAASRRDRRQRSRLRHAPERMPVPPSVSLLHRGMVPRPAPVESVALGHGNSVRCVRYTELTLQGVAGR